MSRLKCGFLPFFRKCWFLFNLFPAAKRLSGWRVKAQGLKEARSGREKEAAELEKGKRLCYDAKKIEDPPVNGESGMKITKEEVEHVAYLARLKFNAQEEELFTTQLNSILDYMEQLEKVDTTNVEPTFHAVARKNVFREDAVAPSTTQDLSLSNAPDRHRGFFRVPKIIE